ncbi:hypothetical protein Mapa_002524 [Marchantia paleacea]|nr:hypothetical protein Mapa_002524 [Marchantia paleacea]
MYPHNLCCKYCGGYDWLHQVDFYCLCRDYVKHVPVSVIRLVELSKWAANSLKAASFDGADLSETPTA